MLARSRYRSAALGIDSEGRTDGVGIGSTASCGAIDSTFFVFILVRAHLALEGTASAPAPEYQGLLAILALEREGKPEEGAIERGPIVVCELDKSGFLDEAAELDQVFGALAPLHDPFPRVMSRALRF
jgi:hypothetical protein